MPSCPLSSVAPMDRGSYYQTHPPSFHPTSQPPSGGVSSDVTLPPMLPLSLSQLRERDRTRFASFLSDDSDVTSVAPPVASRVGLKTYSQQLKDYITRYRCRPPDIKFWPYGPYWPRDHDGVHLDTPRFLRTVPPFLEPRAPRLRDEDETSRTVDNQTTPYHGRWRGTLIVYDCERSPREYNPQPVSEGCCPSLVFESRFESGNLRQARRIGMYEYELVLKTDLYTNRHTQWFFFLVRNVQPGVTYKFRIVNLLKTDSLYNYGMRPLVYSEKDAAYKDQGWVRTGHHISYTKNITNNTSPLLSRCVHYYMLEWQMEFNNAADTYYLAHCYPYTFTDLKEDLDTLLTSPLRKACVRREVLCESRAGNSCFLLTVTNFDKEGPKKAVVVTARVHPGESQSSWMMKGLLDFLTGPDPVAQELREKFVFKLVPMLNPDGVIVGNYRCSLAARDLNRNYRHPRRENFPTIYALKAMMEALAQKYEIMVYCDLHGHSRKHNVFMYGNNTSSDDDTSGVGAARAFISERLFPWLMAAVCPDKFSFRSCKFQIRRCKESTGRVVMWRQMNVYNSFTLEATFSGTILDKENCRHFNIQDLMEVGRGLARTVLEYQHLQENKMKQTETVLELTRAITHQILETRGLIEPDRVLPAFNLGTDLTDTEAEAIQEDAEKWTEAMLTLLQQPSVPDPQPAPAPDLDQGQSQGRKEDKVSRKIMNSVMQGLSRDEANKLLDRASLTTMGGCLNMLAALNVREALPGSDDSDSESEPEMKAPEPKKKKKRKSRKQRDREHHDKKQIGSNKRADDKDGRCKTFSTQRFLTAQPREVALDSGDSPLIPYDLSYPGALPSFTFRDFEPSPSSPTTTTTRPPSSPPTRSSSVMSVTSQFVRIVKEDGGSLFLPVRRVLRSRTSLESAGVVGGIKDTTYPGGAGPGRGGAPHSSYRFPQHNRPVHTQRFRRGNSRSVHFNSRSVHFNHQRQFIHPGSRSGGGSRGVVPQSRGEVPQSRGVPLPQSRGLVPQTPERQYYVETLVVGLSRNQAFSNINKPSAGKRDSEDARGNRRAVSASTTVRPRTIRQTLPFGQQITFQCLHHRSLGDHPHNEL
ncbi:hypothetical protein ACOMHN_022337 [Nucella lapillus]